MTPEDGYHYIACRFEAENHSDDEKEKMQIYKGNFTCFADGIFCRQFTYLDLDDSLPYTTLLPGEKIVGSLTYVVPDDADSLEIEYSGYVGNDLPASTDCFEIKNPYTTGNDVYARIVFRIEE